MILISVAHSFKSTGAANKKTGLTEYHVSRRASETAAAVIMDHGIACALFDCGSLMPNEYDDAKLAACNGLDPQLAIEIHCNSNDNPTANYAETIYAVGSKDGRAAAEFISGALLHAFGGLNHRWPVHGAREDDRNLFFLEKSKCPAVIVEGLFISNDEQADWLASKGGAETYGLLVGTGVLQWLQT